MTLKQVRKHAQRHTLRYSTNIRPCETCRVRVDLDEHPEFLRDDCRIRCPECDALVMAKQEMEAQS